MTFGALLIVGGYALFYWGIHHFPGVDCPGSQAVGGMPAGNTCRYSLFDVLGVPRSWGITPGTPIQLNPPAGSLSAIPAAPNEPPNNETQPQLPNNNNTPAPLNPGPSTPELPTPEAPAIGPVIVA